MFTDRELRQRADEVRQQLKVTMQETQEAVLSSKELTDETARCRDGQIFRSHIARTAQSILATRERLDLRTSRAPL